MRMPTIRKEKKNEEVRPIRFLIDDFIKNAFYTPANEERMMAMDVVEQEKEFILTANMPGINKEDIKVYVDGTDLVIEGKRVEDKTEQNETMYRSERYRGHYRRAFTIPETWDCDKIKATYREGVLILTIPKKEAEPEKLITIS